MGGVLSSTEESVQEVVDDYFFDHANKNILKLFDDMTSRMNKKELEYLLNVKNFDWMQSYISYKANANREIINNIILRKIKKEDKRNFGEGSRKIKRTSRRSIKRL